MEEIGGKNYWKINLHMHTTRSDGLRTPEEACALYRARGYDMVALTDHWKYAESGEIGGLRTLGGIEFDVGRDGGAGVYHILGLGCREAPALTREDLPEDHGAAAQAMIDAIHRAGGLAVLAHPHWSLNTTAQAMALSGIDATEIFNAVSDAHESVRPTSEHFVDACACAGLFLPLLASDDAHYYDGSDETKGFIRLCCPPEASDDDLLAALRAGDFYASEGPHVECSREGDEWVARCSPACRVAFQTNTVWAMGHTVRGENITEARCRIVPTDAFVRVTVTDRDGKRAWSSFLRV